MKIFKAIAFLSCATILLSSCAILNPIRPLQDQQAKIFLKNKKVLNGKTTITKSGKVKINNQKFKSDEVEKVVIYNEKKPNIQYELNYEKVKGFFTSSNYWVMKTGVGKYVNSYIGAEGYQINDNGGLVLRGYSRYIGHSGGGGHTELPTYPVYMKKTKDDRLHSVGIEGQQYGENQISSNFRAGVSRYLKDDPKLCKYVRAKKLGLSDIRNIVKAYHPNRTGTLVYNGQKVTTANLEDDILSVNPLEGEMTVFLEYAKQTSDLRDNQISLGFMFYKKLFAIGLGFGYSNVNYLDYSNTYNPYNPIQELEKYYKKGSELSLKVYGGIYHNFSLGNKLYLVPGAYVFLGGRSVFDSDYKDGGFFYGPKLDIDLGKELSVGNMLFVGFTYEYTVCSSSKDETLNYGSVLDNYKPFDPYNRFAIKLSYKF